MNFLDRIKDISDSIVRIEEKIGFRVIVRYVILILLVIGICNFKSIVRSCVELVSEVSSEIHLEKMQKRDDLLNDLNPLLNDFRLTTGADRILYFEYHNSKENLVGIPFKYLDLVMQNSDWKISYVPEALYTDINTGAMNSLYQNVKTGNMAITCWKDMEKFKPDFPDVYEFFNGNDNSKVQVFISIPGVNQPIGLIVLEWVSEKEVDLAVLNKIINEHCYISRINGLMSR